jgi:hypothetical protein
VLRTFYRRGDCSGTSDFKQEEEIQPIGTVHGFFQHNSSPTLGMAAHKRNVGVTSLTILSAGQVVAGELMKMLSDCYWTRNGACA